MSHDKALCTAQGRKKYQPSGPGDTHEGYCAISLLPNLGHTGKVLIIGGTGGSAINAGADFLTDESAMIGLRRLLPATNPDAFSCVRGIDQGERPGRSGTRCDHRGLPKTARVAVAHIQGL